MSRPTQPATAQMKRAELTDYQRGYVHGQEAATRIDWYHVHDMDHQRRSECPYCQKEDAEKDLYRAALSEVYDVLPGPFFATKLSERTRQTLIHVRALEADIVAREVGDAIQELEQALESEPTE